MKQRAALVVSFALATACKITPEMHFDFTQKCTTTNPDCPCGKDSDCDAPCRTGVCTDGACSTVPAPDGPAKENQSYDCAEIACHDGKPIYTLDDSDRPAPRQCSSFRCEAGASPSDRPRTVPDVAPEGTGCVLGDAGERGECIGALCADVPDAGRDAQDDGG